MLVVIFVSLGVMLYALLWLGSLTIQRALYPDATEGLAWRAGVAAAAVLALFAAWCWLNRGAADPSDLPYATLFEFSGYTTKSSPEFFSVKRTDAGKETVTKFTRQRSARGAARYFDDKGKVWSRSDSGMVVAVEVPEDGKRTRFEAELTPDGKFRFGQDNTVRYNEVGGRRYLDDATVGEVVTPRTGRVAANLALNLGHFVLWVLAFLLLQYSFWHALGLGVAAWLTATLVILPTLFQRLGG